MCVCKHGSNRVNILVEQYERVSNLIEGNTVRRLENV